MSMHSGPACGCFPKICHFGRMFRKPARAAMGHIGLVHLRIFKRRLFFLTANRLCLVRICILPTACKIGCGNLSLRLPELSGDSGLALLSATGSWLEELREDQIALCRISDGRCLNGVRPTMEAGFHLGVMRRRPGRYSLAETSCANRVNPVVWEQASP